MMTNVRNLFCFFLFSMVYGIAHADYTELSGRGLIKALYSQATLDAPSQFQTGITLKGVSERATCPTLFFALEDTFGPDIARLALQLNRPVEVKFLIAKDSLKTDPIALSHCQLTQILLKK